MSGTLASLPTSPDIGQMQPFGSNIIPLNDQVMTPHSLFANGGESSANEFAFEGCIVIPGMTGQIPEMTFVQSSIGNRTMIRNKGEGNWPAIAIDAFRKSEESDFRVRSLRIESADDSVDAWLLLTRLRFAIAQSRTLSIVEDTGYRLDLHLEIDPNSLAGLRGRSSVIRKLKYLEWALNESFSIPDEISAHESYMTDVAFRAISKGKFTLRQDEWTFERLVPADLSLDHPPFSGPGRFSRRIGSVEDRRLEFLGGCLDLGPFSITVDKAEIANPWALEGNQHDPVDIRFVVYDSQVSFSFENYAGPTARQANLNRLTEFKGLLSREEPEELVELIDKSLQQEVSLREAVRIAMGWVQFNGFTDRYCVQEPALLQEQAAWSVAVGFAFCDGRGGRVGQLTIDRKTGVVIDHTPVGVMRAEGAALAKRLLDGR